MRSARCEPAGTGAGSVPGELSDTLRGTPGSTVLIASIAARIPLPIAVRRPVTRLCSASSRSPRSVVGAWTISAKPLKATIPIWLVEAWASMYDAAAASAARIRLGGMSPEHMLPETSSDRMIVAWFEGTLTATAGRATAIVSSTRARAKSPKGRCRRRRDRGGRASRISDTLEYRTPVGRRRRRATT